MDKLILDATCGSRMIWFDKNNPLAVYVDRRETENVEIWNGRRNEIKPDIIADFTNLPFEDNMFYLVVFDPPHLMNVSENAWLCKKYGKLDNNWAQVIRDGFNECMRVLKPGGTLVFKWSDVQIPTRDVINAIGDKPLFGHRSGKKSNTHWMCFIKNISE